MKPVTSFQKKVYAYIEDKIPRGKVLSYAAVATALKTSPRAVGQALKHNPYAPRVPCHRVVAADRRIGGFKGKTIGKVIDDKIALLKKEGVEIGRDGRVPEKFFKH